jgi:hypothetical protein
MPATRITDSDVTLAQFDVVGQDDVKPFVKHLGLCASSGQQKAAEVSVHDMGPPLRSPGSMAANVRATADLNDDERRKIASFVDRHANEHKAQQFSGPRGNARSYVIYPHCREETEQDGTHVYTRFSCAGYVIESYQFARLTLLDLPQVPPVSLQQASIAYPEMAAALSSSARLREEFGLTGHGPWPIVLCGYVVHSLARSAVDIRAASYAPSITDMNFG